MGKFTSQGTQYKGNSGSDNTWASLGTNAAQKWITQQDASKLREQSQEDEGRKAAFSAMIQAVNRGQLDVNPNNPQYAGMGLTPAAPAGPGPEDLYKQAQTRKIDYDMSEIGQMDKHLQEFTSDDRNLYEAQRVASDTGRPVQDVLGENARSSFAAAQIAKQAILKSGKQKAITEAKTPKEKKIAIAEALRSQYPDVPSEKIIKMVNDAYNSPLMKGIQSGVQAGGAKSFF